MSNTFYCMQKSKSSYQSLCITEVSTVPFMVNDPGHSLVLTLKGSFYPFTSFSGYPAVQCPLGNAACFDLMPSDIPLALLVRWVKCQVKLHQRVQQSQKGNV